MRLTLYTDYSLRVLIYLAAQESNRLVSIQEIAESYSISKNHLMKVIYGLGKLGYIETIRGRQGGIRLALKPMDISIGQVIRNTEEDFYLAECFDSDKNACIISSSCRLKHILYDALQAYFSVLDQYTLADVVINETKLRQLFQFSEEQNK
ncbi:RrF2 family transcriptional regulator [Caldalkalibacillus mannanilyticus]|uniref:RrF2 family transcriptional regulator n=1 Tax=Caldalkalibacillus mannanilyticus TaxID=1418 RepID=UPI0004691FF9|nr:Rrf2 family transcriptional regulator [Caldalkalibacillus mannanilyticus]